MHQNNESLLFNIIALTNRITARPDRLQEHLSNLNNNVIKLFKNSSTLPPTDARAVLALLRQPVKAWGLDLNVPFQQTEPIMTVFNELSIEAKEYLAYFPEYMDGQSPMLAMLGHLRKLYRKEPDEAQTQYVELRRFLSQAMHAVISERDLRLFSIVMDQDLIDGLKACYEPVKVIGNYRKCPHCGWTLTYRNNRWVCHDHAICKAFGEWQPLETFQFAADETVLRMTPQIQKFVLLPGLAEAEIYEELRKKGHQVEWYPEIDRYDLKVTTVHKVWKLDIKAIKNPYYFAKQIEDKHVPGSDVDYIIPSFYEGQSKHYIKKVHKYLSEKQVQVSLMNEKALLSKVGVKV